VVDRRNSPLLQAWNDQDSQEGGELGFSKN
jgi:hypothetical protein